MEEEEFKVPADQSGVLQTKDDRDVEANEELQE
jgi:hypothetical protein